MDDAFLGLQFSLVLIAALFGGFLARRLKLPIFLGYLIGGIIIGPSGFSLVEETATINGVATVGLILMLFTIGLEFSLPELRRTGKVALLGGIAQVVLTAAAGFCLGQLLGWSTAESIFLGFIIAQTSTAVTFKALSERGELDSAHGRIILGISLVQDISTVPLLVVLPMLAGVEVNLAQSLALALGKAILFVILVLTVGAWVLPRLLSRAAAVHSRELFLLFIIVMAMLTAFGALLFGLSAAIGAFVAGILIGQSIFARQALAHVVPLRDIFGALFFVSLGMLANLTEAFQHPGLLLAVVFFSLVFKFIICSAIPWIFGFGSRTAILAGMGLIPMGEFSFILASTGLSLSIVSSGLFSITLTLVAITMILTPFLMNTGTWLYRRLKDNPIGQRLIVKGKGENWVIPQPSYSGHAVICGHGRTASPLTKIMTRRNLSYVVIELDPVIINNLRRQGVQCIYGDASNPEILSAAHVGKAKLLVCTYPNFLDVELTVTNARRINPKLDIVARVERDTDAEILKDIGVNELVKPQFEASLEITRHALHRYGVNATEIQYLLNSLRQGTMS
ncbi:cation:proton antiporter [Dehalogenimonas sp. 4OHTPN]|uniref:Cation:proton antiporter n=1 Tax=Dehalogenimonas sp. 4OHTPN TaxID=3166643 RepID=A0AAU8GBI4_9CHLR